MNNWSAAESQKALGKHIFQERPQNSRFETGQLSCFALPWWKQDLGDLADGNDMVTTRVRFGNKLLSTDLRNLAATTWRQQVVELLSVLWDSSGFNNQNHKDINKQKNICYLMYPHRYGIEFWRMWSWTLCENHSQAGHWSLQGVKEKKTCQWTNSTLSRQFWPSAHSINILTPRRAVGSTALRTPEAHEFNKTSTLEPEIS